MTIHGTHIHSNIQEVLTLRSRIGSWKVQLSYMYQGHLKRCSQFWGAGWTAYALLAARQWRQSSAQGRRRSSLLLWTTTWVQVCSCPCNSIFTSLIHTSDHIYHKFWHLRCQILPSKYSGLTTAAAAIFVCTDSHWQRHITKHSWDPHYLELLLQQQLCHKCLFH